jgi:nicotinamide-nucleotide amidase
MAELGFCVDEELIAQAEAVVSELRRSGVTVVTAESCTGGLIAAALSHAPGASECLHGGFVVYTKTHKAQALGVSKPLLESSGSVNAEVARQLSRGALERSPAQVALAVTGVLGPDPDEDGNPPGLVYLGVQQRGQEARVLALHFNDDKPDAVRRAVVERALSLLRESIDS